MLTAIVVISSLQLFMLWLILGALGDLRRDLNEDMGLLLEVTKVIRTEVNELVEQDIMRDDAGE